MVDKVRCDTRVGERLVCAEPLIRALCCAVGSGGAVTSDERVRFQGSNGVRYHHSVVRAMPGGPKGFPLPKASAEQTVTVKLDEVRAANNKGLDDFLAELKKRGADFNFASRPMALRNLKVVGFVQNDETNEVLQAVQVDLESGKE